jgi:hypothetical protein
MLDGIKKLFGLLISAVAILSLLLFFPSQPKILPAQIGIVCAVFCSVALFSVCFRTPWMSPVTEIASAFSHILVVAGLPISAFAVFSIMYYAYQLPHFLSSEIGVMCGLLCSFWVFIFCVKCLSPI